MTENLRIAILAIKRGYDYETLKDSDYIYGTEMDINMVWEYVEECKHMGSDAFYKKYFRDGKSIYL